MKKICAILLVLLASASLKAEIRLPRIIGDNMVLQRDAEVNLWGSATPNTKVKVNVSWSKQQYTATANDKGEWIVKVKTPGASRNETITLSDGKEIKLSNILIGEVWVCSGQSNMDMPVMGFSGQPVEHSYETLLSAGKERNIRLFTVARNSVSEPQNDCKDGCWLESSTASVAKFSAVAYFFGKALSDALDIPIGLIGTSWGGANIETWMSEEAIDHTPGINHEAAKSGDKPNSRVAYLYNGMICPITKYTAKGFIWYQGESNRERYADYDKLMVSMVHLWRTQWNDDKMPFYFVQLAPYNYGKPDDALNGYQIEAQYKAMKEIPYSGIAATTDIGHPTCIHPPFKKEVGDRLAFMALRNDYRIQSLPDDAPTYKSMLIKENRIILQFNNIEYPNCFEHFDKEGTKELKGFEVAGIDRVFYPAKANIANNNTEIVVSSDRVQAPVAVRYAFKNFSINNVTTLWKQPLVPFRTDNW